MKLEIKPGSGGVTNGTEIYLDGQKMANVHKLVLTAEVDSCWRAELHFHPSELSIPEGMVAEVTCFESPAREYRLGKAKG